MGCFSFRCGLSGLPIYAGEPVRWLLLTSVRAHVSARYHTGEGPWIPRTIPIPGRYNDYGSLDYRRTPSTRLLQQLVRTGLEVDVVERGWGPNTCHDVTVTRRDLRHFDRILEAAWEGRLLVRDEVGYKPRYRKVPRGVPTRARVERILRHYQLPGIVSENAPGRIMVRTQCFGTKHYPGISDVERGQEAEALAKVIEAVAEQAPAYVTELRQTRRRETFLVIRAAEPQPSAVEGRPVHLPVAPTMVREDVWQGAVDLFTTRESVKKAVKGLRAELLRSHGTLLDLFPPEQLTEIRAPVEDGSDHPLKSLLMSPRGGSGDEFFLTSTGHEDGTPPFMLGPGASITFMRERVRGGLLDPNSRAVTAALRGLVELREINRNVGGYSGVGAGWHPHHITCQESIWEKTFNWQDVLRDIAKENWLREWARNREG